MKYIITHQGSEHEIDITEGEGSSWNVTLDGESCNADFRRIDGDDIYSLLMENASFELLIVNGEVESSVIQSGRSIDLTVESARQHQARLIADDGDASGEQVVRSVMPGIVVAVEVAEGDTVEAGQGLCVLEAMKMENEICAAAPGIVRSISVEAGQTVGGGEVLMEIEAPEESPRGA